MKNITLISAIAENGAIGNKNQLLYHLPNDMKRFKELTTNHTIIMGRKTFESFPKGALPNRRNIVITHQDITFDNVEVCHSLKEALDKAKSDDEIFIIGGSQIYSQALIFATKMELTVVHDTPQEADAFFPSIEEEKDIWKKTFSKDYKTDEKHKFDYTFETWEAFLN